MSKNNSMTSIGDLYKNEAVKKLQEVSVTKT